MIQGVEQARSSILKTTKKQNHVCTEHVQIFFLSLPPKQCPNNSLDSIHIVLGIISNLGMI
jgi:hypothetical protein